MVSNEVDRLFLDSAIEQAMRSEELKGLPIGAALAIDGTLVALGHNQRVQLQNPTLHAEIDCLKNAGPRDGGDFAKATLYSTLSPCWMCAGAAVVFGIKRIVVADRGHDVAYQERWRATEDFFSTQGIEFLSLEDERMIRTFRDFIAARPADWGGDVGEAAETPERS